MAKEKVQEEIDILLQKGVNVTVIEQQTKITEDKIAELDKRLEELPNVRERLVMKYREEKEEQLKNNESRDYLEERRVENSQLFKANIIRAIYKNLDNENVQKIETQNYGRKR